MSDSAGAPQRVLVTGGAEGIGLVITRAFVSAGARVHVADVNGDAVAAVTASADAITGSVCDITDPAAVTAMFEDLVALLADWTCSSTTPASRVRRLRCTSTRPRHGTRLSPSTSPARST